MMITPTEIRVTDDRRQDLLAAAARARIIAAPRPSHSATPRPVSRIRDGLRQAVAALVAFAAIG
jgi:hypothetical protein